MFFFALEQLLNGIQLGMMLFLMAAGLTLVFGVMNVINLAHGSLYMVGAYAAAATVMAGGSFLSGLLAATVVTGAVGFLLEVTVFRRLYERSALDQVLATFALTLLFNGAARWIFGRQPYQIEMPSYLSGLIEIGSFSYPAYRFVFVVVGGAMAGLLYVILAHTRMGMLVRAGSTHPVIVAALGADLGRLFGFIFGLSAVLAGIAGALVGPIQAVDAGMGDSVVVLALVVIVVGGIGSVRGAFVAALLIGMLDTCARALLPQMMRAIIDGPTATLVAGLLAPVMVYLLMALVLLFQPRGLMGGKI